MNDTAPGRDTALALAEQELLRAGLKILGRPDQAGHEPDIIALARGRVLVAITVTTPRPGEDPADLDDHEVLGLLEAARAWQAAHGMAYEEIRLDVIGLTPDAHGTWTTEHIEGVA